MTNRNKGKKPEHCLYSCQSGEHPVDKAGIVASQDVAGLHLTPLQLQLGRELVQSLQNCLA